MSYDCAFLMNDDKEMASALWRRFFIDEPFDGPLLDRTSFEIYYPALSLSVLHISKEVVGVDRQLVHL